MDQNEEESDILQLLARITKEAENGEVRSIAIVVISPDSKIHEHYAQRKD